MSETRQPPLFELDLDAGLDGGAPELPATADDQSGNGKGQQQEQHRQQSQHESRGDAVDDQSLDLFHASSIRSADAVETKPY